MVDFIQNLPLTFCLFGVSSFLTCVLFDGDFVGGKFADMPFNVGGVQDPRSVGRIRSGMTFNG